MPPSPPRTALALAAAAAAAALALGAAPASGAARGETVLLGGVPLPAGALAGGDAGSRYTNARAVDVDETGRYVVFLSDADVFGPGGDPTVTQVYRKDRVTGAVELVSRADGPAGIPAGDDARAPRVSADGTRVAWVTEAALDPADADGALDVYVRDLATGTTRLASPATARPVEVAFDLSADGRFVVFTTTDAIDAGDQNGLSDVYRRELGTGLTGLVSRVRGTTAAGNRASGEPSISADGSWVAYSSAATDLTPGFVDRNGGSRDVWIRSMNSGDQLLVSQRAFAGNEGGNGASRLPRVALTAGPSLYVAYESSATDVAADGADTSPNFSVYRRWLGLSPSTLVSRADGATGADADAAVSIGDISADGRRVAFHARAASLGAGDVTAAFVRDVGAATTARVSPAAPALGTDPAISGDGSLVAWSGRSTATPTSDPSLSAVFARPAGGGELEHVSRTAGGEPLLSPAVAALDGPVGSGVSADGRYVLLAGVNARLAGYRLDATQLYRLDTRDGAIELVSRADGRDGASSATAIRQPSISADGQRVAFVSADTLAPGDPADGRPSLFVRDVAAGTTVLASRVDGADGASLEVEGSALLAAGGRHAAFVADDGSGRDHAFLRDLASGATTLVDRAGGAAGQPGDDDVSSLDLSADGGRVVFDSRARNLDPADLDDDPDVFVRDVAAATTTLASRRPGLDGAKATGGGARPLISDDGRVVVFDAYDEQLVPGTGTWTDTQIVTRELASGVNRLVSRGPDGTLVGSKLGERAVDGDGDVVAFAAEDSLLPGQPLSHSYLYVRSLADDSLIATPSFGGVGGLGAAAPALSADGRCLAFVAAGASAVAAGAGDHVTTYGTALADGCFARGATAPPPPRDGGDGETRPAAPRLTHASLLRARFRVGPRATAKTAAKRPAKRRRAKAVPAGTAFRFSLDRAATVTVALSRPAAGRKVGRACRKPTRKLRKKRACTRWVAAGTLTRRGLAAGRRSLAFSGRVGRRALAPGRYRATLTASNAAGRSRPVTLAFTVVRAAPTRRRPARR